MGQLLAVAREVITSREKLPWIHSLETHHVLQARHM